MPVINIIIIELIYLFVRGILTDVCIALDEREYQDFFFFVLGTQ